MNSASEFARRVFFWSGVYGIIVIAPQYLFEHLVGQQYPPAITHPEYFYGFVGVGLAWQIAFLLISRDPLRMQPVMLAGALEKFSFGTSTLALVAVSRAPVPLGVFATIDLVIGILFLICYAQCGKIAPKDPEATSITDDDSTIVENPL